MSRRPISFLPLILLLLLPACHHHPANRVPILIPPATLALPLLDPAPLSAGQIEQIRSLVQSNFPKCPPIWFILLLDNNISDDPHYSVIVYFIPEKQTLIRTQDFIPTPPILREGRCITINNLEDPGHPTLSDLLTYIQVPDSSLTPNPVLVPTLAELPLLKPANISDSELAELIATARAAYVSHNIAPNTPIIAIERSVKIPDMFHIQIGQSASPENARGVTLTIHHYKHYYFVDPETTPWPEPATESNP